MLRVFVAHDDRSIFVLAVDILDEHDEVSQVSSSFGGDGDDAVYAVFVFEKFVAEIFIGGVDDDELVGHFC